MAWEKEGEAGRKRRLCRCRSASQDRWRRGRRAEETGCWEPRRTLRSGETSLRTQGGDDHRVQLWSHSLRYVKIHRQ